MTQSHNKSNKVVLMEHHKPTTRLIQPSDGVPKLLVDLLSIPTPHKHEALLHSLLPSHASARLDKFGNYIVDVDYAKTRTIFSCHMDTMHTEAYHLGKKIDLLITDGKPKPDENGFIYGCILDKGNVIPSILGADDKIGMWLCSEMIKAGVPGRYIFHCGEERGGLGAGWIAENTPWIVKNFDRAVALDRMHYGDIIHTQYPGPLISKEFEKAFETELNRVAVSERVNHVKFKGCVGMFTDTAKYKDLVPECTNISVGYFDQHSAQEHFDLIWVRDILLPMLKKVEWEKLPTKRDPSYKPAYSIPKSTEWAPAYLNNGRSTTVPVEVKEPKMASWSPVADGLPGGTSGDQADAILDWVGNSSDTAVVNGILYLLYDARTLRAQIKEQVCRLNDLQNTVTFLRAQLAKTKQAAAPPEQRIQPDYKGLDDDPNSPDYIGDAITDVLTEEEASLAEALQDKEDTLMQDKFNVLLDVAKELDDIMLSNSIAIDAIPQARGAYKKLDTMFSNLADNDKLDVKRLNRYIAKTAENLTTISEYAGGSMSSDHLKTIEKVISDLMVYVLAHIREPGFESINKKSEIKETVH